MANSEQHMTDVVHAYVQALNTGDLDAIMALYAENASVEDPVGSPAKVGRAAIHEFYARTTSMQLVVTLEGEVRAVGNVCVFPFSVQLEYDGKPTTIRPIDVFEFDDAGQVRSMRAYFGSANIHQ